MNKKEIIEIINTIIPSLNGNGTKLLEKGCVKSNIKIDDARKAVKNYGRMLSPIPKEATDAVILYDTEKDGEFYIEADLWIDGKKSDLTMSLSAKFYGGKVKKITIEDIRTL